MASRIVPCVKCKDMSPTNYFVDGEKLCEKCYLAQLKPIREEIVSSGIFSPQQTYKIVLKDEHYYVDIVNCRLNERFQSMEEAEDAFKSWLHAPFSYAQGKMSLKVSQEKPMEFVPIAALALV